MTDQLIELGKVSVKANGRLYNGHVDEVLAEQRRRSEAHSATGRAGGRSKGERGKSAETNAKPTRTDREMSVNHLRSDAETRSTSNQISRFGEADPSDIEKIREDCEEEWGSSTPILGDGAKPAGFEFVEPISAKPDLALPAIVAPAALKPSPTAERFEEFWTLYPHRGGVRRKRKEAYAKYQGALRSGVPEDSILEGARRARDDPTVRRGYARDPATWLHQEGWADEMDAPLSPDLYGSNRGTTDVEDDRRARADQRLLASLDWAARAG